MKKLLILTSKSERTASWTEREGYVRGFAEQLEQTFNNTKVFYSTYEDLEYSVIDGKIGIKDAFNKRALTEYDFVHFKNWTYEAQEASIIATYLEWNGIPYANSEVKTGFVTSKICQMIMLAKNNVKVPNTFYARKDRLKDNFINGLPASFTYPLIMKANNGSKGDNNFLINNAEEALKILEDFKQDYDVQFVLQDFHPNNGDYRLLYIGLDNDPLIFRRLAAAGSHLNNTSKGGSGELVDAKDFPEHLLKQAEKAAKVLKREIGGVDILVNKHTNKGYVLEVNGTPALATGYALDEKLSKFTDFIDSLLEAQEEE